MRRFVLLVLAGVALSLTTAPAQAAAASCVSSTAATYRHSFHGPSGTSTVTAVRPLCSGQTQAFSLVSYTSGGGLFVYDVNRATITAARQSATLKVAVPTCSTHVYALTGTSVLNETTGTPGYPVLGSSASRSSGPTGAYAIDTTGCAPAPRVTFTNACDGTFQAAVTNAASANVPAVVISGERLLRVAPGRTTILPAAAGTTLTFRASNRTTYVGTWRTPATPCTTATTAAPTASTPQSAAAPPPAATVSPSAAVSASPSAETVTNADSVYSNNPTALDAKTAAAAPAKPGMSIGSIFAIALGLLLMVAGIWILTKLIKTNRQPA